MLRTKSKMQLPPTPSVVVLAAVIGLFYCGGLAVAANYGISAHGDAVEGVNRAGTTYDIGDCTHCHDTFDDAFCGINDYMLFAPNNPTSQTDNFCFQCHKGTGSEQNGGITNNTYSTNFGGGTPTFTTIYDAFNPTTGGTPSSHSLADISSLVSGYYGFTDESNACLACHNQHLAQQNYEVTTSGLGGVKTAIRRIVDNDSAPGDLWGDEDSATSEYYELTNEVIENYGLVYQAPYYVGGSTYEPAGDSTSDGSNLPNIITFCLDCHQYSTVYSTAHGRNLSPIDWSNQANRDEHGLRNAYINTNQGNTKAPYPDQSGNYVLVCTDCHEPHGSENEWLLRTTVNGTDVSIQGPNQWWYFCAACHKGTRASTEDYPADQHTAPWDSGTDCYNNGICHHHNAGGGMF